MKKKQLIKIIVILILFIIQLLSTGYILYALTLLSGIETMIRILFAISLVLILSITVMCYLKSIKKKKSKYYIYIPIILVYSIVLLVFGHFIHKTYSALNKLTTTSTAYSSSLVTLSSNKINSIDKIGNGVIGMVNDESNQIGYIIPNNIIKEEKLKNTIKEYNSYIEIINALYDKEIQYAFLPTNYTVMFAAMDEVELDDIKEKTKIIYTKEEAVKNETTNKSTTITEPFTVLLMGVDSETENISSSSFNGDSLIVITFNPNTLSATLLSIPRDSYVPITCFAGNKKNKITHAAWYGEQCMINTISNFLDIEIDYYAKINFKGVVKMVDALGGVEIDVPYSFCEQDSNRLFGDNTIYIHKGLQVLNGEQALAFARNRHTWPHICGPAFSDYVSNDFIRGRNQQTVLRALLNKLKDIKDLNTIYELLDVIGQSMETNMSTNEILSFYNIAKDILVSGNGMDMDELISIQRLSLSGYSQYIYDTGMKLNLYNYVLYDGSIKDVSQAMKINLGEIEPELVKTFSFSIDDTYEEETIGEEYYTATTDERIVPDFIGDDEAQAKITANKLGIKVSFIYTEATDGQNTVVSQSYPAGTSMRGIGLVTLTIAKPKKTVVDKTPTVDEDDKNYGKEDNTTSDKDSDKKDDVTSDKDSDSSTDDNKNEEPVVEEDTDKENNSSENTEEQIDDKEEQP